MARRRSPETADAIARGQRALAELEALGARRSDVARALARDSSYLSQLAAGRKGANLAPQLEALARNVAAERDVRAAVRAQERAFAPARRRTSEGRAARVRQGEIVRRKAVAETDHRYLAGRVVKGRARALVTELARAADAGQQVALGLSYQRVTGGTGEARTKDAWHQNRAFIGKDLDPADLLARILELMDEGMSAGEALDVIADESEYGVAGALVGYDLSVY